MPYDLSDTLEVGISATALFDLSEADSVFRGKFESNWLKPGTGFYLVKALLSLNDGPYATLLRKLSRLQDRLPHKVDFSPVRVAIITARNSPAEIRVIKTLRHWGGVCG
ncbi:5'-nucleotidase [Marinobacter sp. ATCH36]|uniref:5'-nucleotidase n=1 Tax=Marinobacter sp. ATCH36 TaxID=2945106 RepID=UPI002021D1F2|nr:5'-nucleotidase [Marinobacter sp. ATCH36]MCL7943672.1 5'-nucleotidase [Marinobacter sp. ATCH36]